MSPVHDYVVANGTGAAVRQDLNDALAAIVSNNSSATEPTTTYAYMWWADTNASQLKLRNAANDGWVTIQELDGTMLMEDGTAGAPGLAFASDLDTGFYRPAANELGIATGGTGRLFIDASGRVGVGAAPSTYQLEVNGGAANTVAQFESTDSIARVLFKDDAGEVMLGCVGDDAVVYTSTSATERARCDSSGRLLVGASSSVGTAGGYAPKLQVASTGNASAISTACYSTGVTPSVVLQRSRGSLGAQGLVSSGDVLGSVSFEGSDGSNFLIGAKIDAIADTTTGTNDLPTRLSFFTTANGASSPTERMRISNTGGVRLPDVYNQTIATGANVFIDSDGTLKRATSSIKYKTNVETLEDQYADAVLNCRPVWYQSTSPSDNPDWGFWGFIAEEVAEIDPRLVQWKVVEQVINKDGSRETVPLDTPEPENVAYDRFVPHLLNLIKRQQQAIETLEAKVAALESA